MQVKKKAPMSNPGIELGAVTDRLREHIKEEAEPWTEVTMAFLWHRRRNEDRQTCFSCKAGR